jgi:Site-specific recombinases, DNA invertase Pin homologs
VGGDRKAKENGSGFAARAGVRCGIYTRKSTDEGLDQAFNTLDAQREAAESFINSQRQEGWVALPQKYDDGGYTGANMDRPGLKRLLADIQSGTVNCVAVYKVDRLSRSLLDFARIMEILDKHGATFVSVTQQFNTTSSMGRLTLNVLLSFAQFEREMISERTRDKMGAARRKGKWVGGNPVIGYDVAPQGGSLLVNQEEAKRVREIFALYLELGSLIPVVEELDRRGWRMKSWTTREGRKAGGKPIAKNNLYNLLTNMIYVGKVDYDGKVYDGEHDRIVDDETWNRVQSALNRNGRRGGRNIGNKYAALLKGLVRCASCNVGMIHTYVNKKDRLYRYYVCVKAHQRGWTQCETRSVSAPALENAVVEQLRGIGQNPTILREVLRKLGEHRHEESAEIAREKTDIEKELRNIAQEMKETVSVAGSAGSSGDVATSRLVELQDQVSHLTSRLAELRQQLSAIQSEGVDTQDVEVALHDFDPLWKQLSTWEQEKFIRTLVEHVRYDGKSGMVTLGFRSRGMRDFCTWAPALTEKHEHAKQRS